MGGCVSSPQDIQGPTISISEEDRQRHRNAEKALREAKVHMDKQLKVLLLGSGDSGKSTISKQMRIIHQLPWSPQEIESYRQLVFDNLTRGGLKVVFDAMADLGIEISPELKDSGYIEMIQEAADIRDGEPYPMELKEPLRAVWNDPSIQETISRGNEAALPENLQYFFPDLDRLFDPGYQPSDQDIIHARARTIGITETIYKLKENEMLMVDVGGQKSERRKWIHCFQDVTSILFLASLSGYDQCLVEDRDANQMQDAMTIWDSICHSQWFKKTSIILFLNKYDLFKKRLAISDIKSYFPDFDGPPNDERAGKDYFKRRFTRLAQKARDGRTTEGRDVYVHVTTATDTANLRVIMAAVEE